MPSEPTTFTASTSPNSRGDGGTVEKEQTTKGEKRIETRELKIYSKMGDIFRRGGGGGVLRWVCFHVFISLWKDFYCVITRRWFMWWPNSDTSYWESCAVANKHSCLFKPWRSYMLSCFPVFAVLAKLNILSSNRLSRLLTVSYFFCMYRRTWTAVLQGWSCWRVSVNVNFFYPAAFIKSVEQKKKLQNSKKPSSTDSRVACLNLNMFLMYDVQRQIGLTSSVRP